MTTNLQQINDHMTRVQLRLIREVRPYIIHTETQNIMIITGFCVCTTLKCTRFGKISPVTCLVGIIYSHVHLIVWPV